MKIRTMLASLAGAGVGYVLGAAAGRERFEQIKSQAQRIVSDPDVRQKVADLPNHVKENLPKAQSVVTDTVKNAQDKVSEAKSDSPSTAGSAFSTTETTLGGTDLGGAGAGFVSGDAALDDATMASDFTLDAPASFDTPGTFATTDSAFETTISDTPTTADPAFDTSTTVEPGFDEPGTTTFRDDRI